MFNASTFNSTSFDSIFNALLEVIVVAPAHAIELLVQSTEIAIGITPRTVADTETNEAISFSENETSITLLSEHQTVIL